MTKAIRPPRGTACEVVVWGRGGEGMIIVVVLLIKGVIPSREEGVG